MAEVLTDTVTETVVLPADGSPFGTGPRFVVVIREDVTSLHGNVSVTAGRYEAQQDKHGDEGDICVWSPNYYARGDRDGGWVSLPPWSWTFPGEPARPLPDHDCFDNLRSGVAGGVFCGICQTEIGQ